MKKNPMKRSRHGPGLGLIEVLASMLISVTVLVGVAVSMNISKKGRASLTSEADFYALLEASAAYLESPDHCRLFLTGGPVTNPAEKTLNLVLQKIDLTVSFDPITGMTSQNFLMGAFPISQAENYRNLDITSVTSVRLSNAMPPKYVGSAASYLISVIIQASALGDTVGPRNFSNATNPLLYTVDTDAAGNILNCYRVQKAGGPAGGWRI